MSNGHAVVSISALGMTVACNASLQLQASVPPLPETEEEAEGTAAHLVAMWAAQGRLLDIGEKFISDGREWTVNVEMRNGARIYAQAIGAPDAGLRLEQPVRATRIHPTECWGTPDAARTWKKVFIDDEKNVVRIGDYKYGHRFVEVFENLQLIGYAVGEMERLGLIDLDTTLELILVQPRCYHRDGPVRTWRVHATGIRALVNVAFNSAAAALGPKPIARTGTHCLDCRARHVCDTLRHSAANVVDYSGTAELAPLDEIAMGQELRVLDAAAKRLEARRTGLAVAVEAALRAGRRVPHFELQPRRVNLQWRDDVKPEKIAAVADLLGVSIRHPLETFTPRQAIEAGIDEGIIMQYAHRPPGALALKPVSTTNVDKVISS